MASSSEYGLAERAIGKGEGQGRRPSDSPASTNRDDRKELIYPTADEVVSLYGELVGVAGGDPTDLVRDWNLLESALVRPRHAALYEHAGLARQTALLLWGPVKNHPFVDGNKRAAHLIAITFLDVNGHQLQATEDEQLDLMLKVTAEGLDVDEVEAWIQKHLAAPNRSG